MELTRNTQITWLGHSTFKIVSPRGKHVLIDPWLGGNPSCPEPMKRVDRVDLILATHGHFDHIADVVDLAKAHKAKVVGIYELCNYFGSKGVEGPIGMGKGGTVDVDGIKVTLTNAFHSSSVAEEGKPPIYVGEPAGFVVEFENGVKLYHAGDTCVFGDMKIIGELYQPELAMLPIGDLYTMSPREAAYACRLLKPRFVIPIHWGTFPALTGTPQQLKELIKDLPGLHVFELKPGDTVK